MFLLGVSRGQFLSLRCLSPRSTHSHTLRLGMESRQLFHTRGLRARKVSLESGPRICSLPSSSAFSVISWSSTCSTDGIQPSKSPWRGGPCLSSTEPVKGSCLVGVKAQVRASCLMGDPWAWHLSERQLGTGWSLAGGPGWAPAVGPTLATTGFLRD